MLNRITGFLVILFGASLVHAQVEVQLQLRQEQFLAKEPLNVGVRVLNRSGQELQLTGGDWLELIVMDADGFPPKRLRPLPAAEDMSIQSSYMGTQWFDIGSTFDLKENQGYTVRARVRLSEWDREFLSEAHSFEIIRGGSIWEQKFGVPTETPGEQPEIRTYILQQAIYLDAPQLYLRITDESKEHVFAVKRLAPLVQVSRPDARIDSLSRLHVFMQVSVTDFAHMVIDPDGKLLQRNTYVAQGVRPSMQVSDSGSIYIAGGTRRLRRSDIPTPQAFMPQTTSPAPVGDLRLEQGGAAEPEPPEMDPMEKAAAALEKRTAGTQ